MSMKKLVARENLIRVLNAMGEREVRGDYLEVCFLVKGAVEVLKQNPDLLTNPEEASIHEMCENLLKVLNGYQATIDDAFKNVLDLRTLVKQD